MSRDPSASYKSRDRGPIEFESRLHEEEGNIMEIANRNVVGISPGFPIKKASEKMLEEGFRRLPVISPGTDKLHGMLVSTHIVDFLGGGEKNKIIRNKHNGNFLSAINEGCRIIMNPDAPKTTNTSSISEVAKLLCDTGVGGVPILDKEEKVVGIVTERDFTGYMPSPAKARVDRYMTNDIITANPNLFLLDAMKRMISEGFRRLPVVEDGELVGILTSMDVLSYFATSEIFEHMESEDAVDAMSIEINEIMTKDPFTTTPDADLGEIAEVMKKKNYSGLPVLENGTLVGLITERDMLEILI